MNKAFPIVLIALFASSSALAGELRDHRGGKSPEGGVSVTNTGQQSGSPWHGGGGGGNRNPTTKVTTPPSTSGPGWNGKVRCHTASCFGTVTGESTLFGFEHGSLGK